MTRSLRTFTPSPEWAPRHYRVWVVDDQGFHCWIHVTAIGERDARNQITSEYQDLTPLKVQAVSA